MITLAALALAALVLAYAVWATRDVMLKRMHSDARMDALEKKLEAGLVKMFSQADGLIGSLQSRLDRLEGRKGGELLAATQDWRK